MACLQQCWPTAKAAAVLLSAALIASPVSCSNNAPRPSQRQQRMLTAGPRDYPGLQQRRQLSTQHSARAGRGDDANLPSSEPKHPRHRPCQRHIAPQALHGSTHLYQNTEPMVGLLLPWQVANTLELEMFPCMHKYYLVQKPAKQAYAHTPEV